MEGNALRGVVAERFGSCAKFALALNWSGRKTRDIVSGRQLPTTKDIKEMASVLEIDDANELMRVFFRLKVHKVDFKEPRRKGGWRMYLVSGTQAEIIALCIELEEKRRRDRMEEEKRRKDRQAAEMKLPTTLSETEIMGRSLKVTEDYLRELLKEKTEIHPLSAQDED